MTSRYPFAAIVGQERVKRALLYNLIEPRIGGALLCGEKGTGKSTVVRGLSELTGKMVIDLPLSVTEDMLVGSIDFEWAVKEGVRAFSGGILERVDGNILYVDEVNLLPDGIVSTLICAAASGENLVEREGVSFCHDCRFVLIGTMNPEEGTLRSQFLDRFGLYVEVNGEQDVALRTEIIRRRMDYERNPDAFCRRWQRESEELSRRLAEAIKRAAHIEIDEPVRRLAAQYAIQAGAEGNRCELILACTAAAAAAWAGRTAITPEDIQEAAYYVLPHRRRQDAPQPQPPQDLSERENQQSVQSPAAPPPSSEDSGYDSSGESSGIPGPERPESSSGEEKLVQGEDFFQLSLLPDPPQLRRPRQGSGRRSKTKSGTNKGRYASFTARPTRRQRDLALDATLRAAAPYQSARDHTGCAVALTEQDLRFKVREDRIGATIVFTVDASGSMGAGARMKAAKEAVLSMLLESYQKRDRIGLVAFCREEAQTLLEITSSIDLAQKRLQLLPTGGRTPLAAGLYQSWQMLKARRLKDPDLLPMLVLVTDGRANRSLWTKDPVADALRAAEFIRREGIQAVVIDTENEFISLHIAKQVADVMDASYYKVSQLKGGNLREIVKSISPLTE